MFRLILLVLFVLVVVAFKFLPWWALLIIGGAVILLSKFLAGRAFMWLFSAPFRAKGKVLRGATVEVHSVRVAAAPPKLERAVATPRLAAHDDAAQEGAGEFGQGDGDEYVNEPDDEDEAGPDVPREYYEIDVTITPQTPTGPFMHWDYDEVMLVKPGRKWDDDDDDTCEVADVHAVREGTVLIDKAVEPDDDEDEGTKVIGPLRLKMLVGVVPGVRELAFGYFFETFGAVQLPGR